jgi:hypothetical protein
MPQSSTTAKPRRETARPKLDVQKVHSFVEELLSEHAHAQRVLSISNGVVGVIHAAALSIHAIGHGLAIAKGLISKHTIKQVDRLLSNGKFDVWQHFALWVPYLIGERREIVVALDWTDFEADDHTTIALYLGSSGETVGAPAARLGC